jgi:hypothetical protein
MILPAKVFRGNEARPDIVECSCRFLFVWARPCPCGITETWILLIETVLHFFLRNPREEISVKFKEVLTEKRKFNMGTGKEKEESLPMKHYRQTQTKSSCQRTS